MHGQKVKRLVNWRQAALERLLYQNFFSIALIAAMPRWRAMRALKLINEIETLNLTRRERKAFYYLIVAASAKPKALLANPLALRIFAWSKVTPQAVTSFFGRAVQQLLVIIISKARCLRI